MKTTFIIALMLVSSYLIGQKNETVKNPVKYIQDYYSNFSTGYDFDGNFITLSDNYKTTFSDNIFTLTFNSFDENKITQNQTIIINLKDVVSIEPNSTEVIEVIGNDLLIIPLCGKLAFKTFDETYEINIYYEVDEDVERTKIFKAFEKLIKPH